MVRGQLLVYLVLFCAVNPSASIDKARAFLYNVDPMVGVPFHPAAVAEAEHLLGLRRRVPPTTYKRAFLPLNKHKRFIFWNQNYPLSQADVWTQDMIDIDEARIKIEHTNPNFGKTVLWFDATLRRSMIATKR
jgi:hypothetical protein